MFWETFYWDISGDFCDLPTLPTLFFKWSECIKLDVGMETCHAGHIGVLMQGSIHVILHYGSGIAINAGEAYRLADGHDAWVMGEEPALGIKFSTDSKDVASWTRGLVLKRLY